MGRFGTYWILLRPLITGLALLLVAGWSSEALGQLSGGGGLPLPIVGADAYEPDDTPSAAKWFNLGAAADLSRMQTRNFDRLGDVDWVVFWAPAGQAITVETRDLLSASDTFLSVYRLPVSGDVLVDLLGFPIPLLDCLGQQLSAGALPLIPVGCDDNSGGEGGRASRFSFVAERSTLYYVKVQYSPYVSLLGKSGAKTAEGPETTYNFNAYASGGIIANSVLAQVVDAQTGQAVKNATVTLQPLGATIQGHPQGAYYFNGVPDGNYTLSVSAPEYSPDSAFLSVYGGASWSGSFALQRTSAWKHSADTGAPFGNISLSELLRCIQFFNAGTLHCAAGTEDGYAPGAGAQDCRAHDSDYAPSDWSIGIGEVLRLIQFFNANGYHPCAEGEDKYCPGV